MKNRLITKQIQFTIPEEKEEGEEKEEEGNFFQLVELNKSATPQIQKDSKQKFSLPM